jgi:hypothetical protein
MWLVFLAALLIGGFSWIAYSIHSLKQVKRFKPYKVVVGLDYAALWEDFALTPDQGRRFENFAFTAISPDVFAGSGDQEFTAGLSLKKKIPCGAPAWTGGFGEIGDTPTFFLRPVPAGLEFGLYVQEAWWQSQCSHLPPQQRDLARDAEGRVKLGFLPAGYIPEHIQCWKERSSPGSNFDRKQQEWLKILEQHGWRTTEEYPTRIRHRYMSLAYEAM